MSSEDSVSKPTDVQDPTPAQNEADTPASEPSAEVEPTPPTQTESNDSVAATAPPDDNTTTSTQPPDDSSATSSSAEPTTDANSLQVESSTAETGSVSRLRQRLQSNPTASADTAKAVPSVSPIASVQRTAPTPASTTPSSAKPPASEPAAPAEQLAETPSVDAAEASAVPVATQADAAPPQSETEPAATSPAPTPVELPPAVDDLDSQMEAEIEAAMASGELDAIASAAAEQAADAPEQVTEESLEEGARLSGKIQSVRGDSVLLDVGLRSTAVVPARQFTAGKRPEVGQVIAVMFEKFDAEEGLVLVNLPKGMRKAAGNWESLSVGQFVDCMVSKSNKGGLEVIVGSIRGFLPSSQIGFGFIPDLETYLGRKLRVKILEANRRKRNLVVSHKAFLEIERKEAAVELWKQIEIGQTLSGTVKNLKPYGAFVDIGGVDGFLHIGEISWSRIKDPSEVLKEGQQIDVKVLSLDQEKKKISLGMRQLTQDPWASAPETYETGKPVTGKVTRTTDFGAFIELAPGVEGLVHISELDYKRVHRVADILQVGQEVEVQVLEVDLEKKRISLSLKALKAKPETKKSERQEPEPPDEPYERKRKGPLKGGTGSDSGGGLFGSPTDFG